MTDMSLFTCVLGSVAGWNMQQPLWLGYIRGLLKELLNK
jgi:hypothetical protein